MLRDIHCHVDYGMPVDEVIAYFLSLKKEHGIDKINILSIPAYVESHSTRLQNLRALHCKDKLYPYAFAYMGMWHGAGKENYLTQLRKGMAQGFDGLKIIEGKPDVQKATGVRICAPEFDEMFSYAEEQQIPILMHVADPAKFWDRTQLTPGQLARGWCYEGPGFLSQEELYGDVYKVLKRHPNLRFTLAHFFFMSDNLKRAGELFDTYPNVYFDITPGSEMYGNFSAAYDEAREFFIKYSDRIILGTDVNDLGKDMFTYHSSLYHLTTSFLTGKKEEAFEWKQFHCVPLELLQEAANRIKGENFIKLMGQEPKRVNDEHILAELELIETMKDTLSANDLAEYMSVREYFYSKPPCQRCWLHHK